MYIPFGVQSRPREGVEYCTGLGGIDRVEWKDEQDKGGAKISEAQPLYIVESKEPKNEFQGNCHSVILVKRHCSDECRSKLAKLPNGNSSTN